MISLVPAIPTTIFLLALPPQGCSGLVHHAPTDPLLVSRLEFVTSASSSVLMALTTTSAPSQRAVDVGGGFDLLSPPSPSSLKNQKPDVFFPVSMQGLWQCERKVVSVDGNAAQAQWAWQALGGRDKVLSTTTAENYLTRLVPSPYSNDLSGYTVVDRGYEYTARSGQEFNRVTWQVDQPNSLQTNSYNSNLQLDVVWRLVEMPNDQGWGSQELCRIREGNSPLLKAILIKRRFRRNYSYADTKNAPPQRVVEGLEVVQTFRVLDGVAGTESPTSSIKSVLRWTRPTTSTPDGLDVPSGAY